MVDRMLTSAKGQHAFLFLLAPFLVIVAGLLTFLSLREARRSEEAELSVLRETSRAIYEQISVARLWNASHGGLYAAVTPEVPPNPYLADPDRDIVTVDGKRYTKINPAYMSRQLSAISRQRSGASFRIIGRHPLNPANAPDEWETHVLGVLSGSEGTESDGTFEEAGGPVYRAVIPLRIERPCLRCHGQQGYQVGDVKGGISIRIPRGKYDAIRDAHTRGSLISLAIIGVIGLLSTAVVAWLLSKRLTAEMRRSILQHKLSAAMELAGAVAHEMRQPMTVVHCRLEMLADSVRLQEPVAREDIETIRDQCLRMNSCIEKLLQLTEYRTKEYLDGVAILDIAASASSAAPVAGGTDEGRSSH